MIVCLLGFVGGFVGDVRGADKVRVFCLKVTFLLHPCRQIQMIIRVDYNDYDGDDDNYFGKEYMILKMTDMIKSSLFSARGT